MAEVGLQPTFLQVSEDVDVVEVCVIVVTSPSINCPSQPFVTLERTPGLDVRITLDPVDGDIEITDNDGSFFSVQENKAIILCDYLIDFLSTASVSI